MSDDATIGSDDEVLPSGIKRFVRHVGPEPDPIQEEMQAYADTEGFPIIGPEVGGLLRIMARMVDATAVFEFGSGFGYSASWFAGALPPDGRIVLTEIDADELEMAREFFARGDYPGEAVFEHGDALEIVGEYDGPFDVALIDHQKHRYVDGFEAARERLADGGIIVADNMMRGPMDFEDVRAAVTGERDAPDESTRGVVEYLHHATAADGFETTVLPLGSGIAISVKEG